MICNGSVNQLAIFVSRGVTPKYTENKEDSIVVINQKCIRDFNISLEPARRTNLTLHKVPDNKVLKKYDVLINSTGVGTLGRVAQYMGDLEQVTVDSHVTIVRPDHEFIDPIYFGYLIKAKQTTIENLAEGSTGQTELSRDAIKELEIDFIEDRKKQKKIGSTLLNLDKKIQINYQINQTLESIAQAIFKSWFVNFEPVKAKIAAIEAGEDAESVTRAAMSAISGKTDEELDKLQAEQPENYTQLETTAELFPSAMQDSELGEIPEGWVVRTLGSLLIELRRGISPKYTDEDGILVINQKCIRDHSVNFLLARRNDTKLRTVKGRELQVGDILVNSTGVGTLGRLAPIRYLPEPAVVDSHVTVVRVSEEVSPLFINEYMLTKESFIEASGAGSTGQTELRKTVLEELFVVVPNRILIDFFEIILKPISSCIAEKEQENQSLSQLRDTLLLKLLSGELGVNAINEAEG